jgi:hypothetical protein
MATVAIAIGLEHAGFGAITLALDKAMAQARRQKVKAGQNFVSRDHERQTRLCGVRQARVYEFVEGKRAKKMFLHRQSGNTRIDPL